MNRNQFISYINQPDAMSGKDVVLLSELLKNFPYFQTAHLLYAKSLHNQHSIHYNNQLKVTAAYVTDRKVLHRLIIQKGEPDVVEVIVPKVVMASEKVVEEKAEVVSDGFNVDATEVIKSEKSYSEEETIEEAPVVNAPIEKVDEEITSPTIEEEVESVDALEREYLSQAAIATVELEVLNTEIVIASSADNEALAEEDDFVLNTPVVSESKLVDNDFDVAAPHSFLDWLQHPSGAGGNPVKSKALVQRGLGVSSSVDLIDNFLKEAPRLSKPKKVAFYNPVDMAKKSVADDISFVSETLAKIFMMQEDYSKALEAYESLRLKYPEKRLYFASQIKKLRKFINQQKQ